MLHVIGVSCVRYADVVRLDLSSAKDADLSANRKLLTTQLLILLKSKRHRFMIKGESAYVREIHSSRFDKIHRED
jgi:hypothetical protein